MKTRSYIYSNKTQFKMRKQLLLLVVAGIVLGCNSGGGVSKKPVYDTCVVAYNQLGQYLFNTAIVRTQMGYRLLSDSTPGTKYESITQYKLRLPTSKADSVIDSTTHKLLRIKDSYPVDFLPDSLSKYIHIIDTLHTK